MGAQIECANCNVDISIFEDEKRDRRMGFLKENEKLQKQAKNLNNKLIRKWNKRAELKAKIKDINDKQKTEKLKYKAVQYENTLYKREIKLLTKLRDKKNKEIKRLKNEVNTLVTALESPNNKEKLC